MTPVEIVLLRHGAVDSDGRCYGQRHEVALSPAGRAQAAAVAARLGPVPRVISSPSLRARETAAALGADVIVDGRWAERDFGDWEGRPWEDCWAEAPQALAGIEAYTSFTPPGAEPLDAVARRVVAALEGLREPAVVVTHSGPVRLALRHVLGLSWGQAFAFHPAPGSRTCLARFDATWTISSVGCVEGGRPWAR